MKIPFQHFLRLAAWLFLAATVHAQNYAVDSVFLDSGGGVSTGGVFGVSGTMGRAAPSPMSGGVFSVTGGFSGLDPVSPPAEAGDVIFDNISGSANGGSAVTATTWLAGKFALRTQACRLDSVSLLLNSQDFSGAAGPPCTVHLQIYGSDPASGRPSAPAGPVMNLSGRNNPITLSGGQELVKWTPDTPFTLLPNTGYWAVLSAENGKRMGLISSFTRPAGDAGVFGASVTTNAGAAWSSPADAGDSNLKMLIRATPVPPPVAATTIFDNTPGGESGGFGATTTIWLAGKFGPATQAWRLDSLSLLLSSGNFNGNPQPPSTVRLRLFSHDPASGKPGVDIGPVMNLSVLSNPITLQPFHPVEWVPATPFTLLPGAGYWAVLSVDSGAVTGWIPSATMPAGDAATFGFTRSIDSGATWGIPDHTANHKMLIKGIPLPEVPTPGTEPVAEPAADTQTPIPGGTGNFTGFPAGPGLSGDNLVFHGAGAGGQQGLYLTTPGSLQAPALIANLNTPVPGGVGSFLNFGGETAIIIVSGNTALFGGGGSGGQRGLYATAMSPPLAGSPFRIADLATPVPGGSGNFTDFPGAPGLSGNSAVFTGSGAGGQRGVYASVFAPPQAGPPMRIADTGTAIPGGSGAFTEFPGGPSVSGDQVVFAGMGTGGQQGVYAAVFAPPQAAEPPFKIADTATAIPGGTGNFTGFGGETAIIIVSGKTAVFGGAGAGGQRGLYSAILAPPQAGPPSRIADTATAIPGGAGNFTAFGEAGVSETDIAFLGMGSGGQTGIYDLTRGQLLKVIAVGESIQGKTITGLKFTRGGLFEDPIAFQATFEDGSQGVYRIPVITPEFEFRITGLEQVGEDLRLSFSSLAGIPYAIQSSTDLSSASWITLPGTAVFGTGGIVRQVLPAALTQGRQFYRVLQQP